MNLLEPIENTVFLIDSNSQFQHFFQGYCFSDSDFIFGNDGEAQYKKITGQSVNGGQDGCYVIADKLADGTCYFRSDFYGYKKIFYYWSESYFVVSNSLWEMVKALYANGKNISPDYAQLSVIAKGAGSVSSQLFCNDTPVREIKMLPSWCDLVISTAGYRTIVRINKSRAATYQELLGTYVNTWVHRFLTLISDNRVHLRCDLSGGLDSRTVFSLLHRAMQVADIEDKTRLFINSGPNPRTRISEAIVVQPIADRFGYELNKKRFKRQGLTLTGKDSFERWRALNLGVYHPVYLSSLKISPFTMSIGGGGGENFRPFYGSKNSFSLDSVKFSERAALYPYLKDELAQKMKTVLGQLTNIPDQTFDPLILHYQFYRNRLHVGRGMERGIYHMPLGSNLLYYACTSLNPSAIKRGQVLYDIMYNCAPEFLDIPFDEPEKSPNKTDRLMLTNIKIDLMATEPGRIFVGDKSSDDFKCKTIENGASALEYLQEALKQVVTKPFARQLYGSEFVDNAVKVLVDAIDKGKFSHAIKGAPIAAILVTALFDKDIFRSLYN